VREEEPREGQDERREPERGRGQRPEPRLDPLHGRADEEEQDRGRQEHAPEREHVHPVRQVRRPQREVGREAGQREPRRLVRVDMSAVVALVARVVAVGVDPRRPVGEGADEREVRALVVAERLQENCRRGDQDEKRQDSAARHPRKAIRLRRRLGGADPQDARALPCVRLKRPVDTVEFTRNGFKPPPSRTAG
jgi:hypothetical protein